MKKIATYVLMLSATFPAGHPKAGQETGFGPKFMAAMKDLPCYNRKIHTVRGNYELWRKRFEKINAGEAVLSVRQWVGKPYGKGSSMKELARLTKDDGIGLQKFCVIDGDGISLPSVRIDDKTIWPSVIYWMAKNDGLSTDDWGQWFGDYKYGKELAIIHFTKFRYGIKMRGLL